MIKRLSISILALALILSIAPIHALAGTATIKFEWNPNTETDLKGYRLYKSSAAGTYVYVGKDPNLIPAKTGTSHVKSVAAPSTTVEIDVTAPENTAVYFVLTAFDAEGNESGPSNQVSYVMPIPADTTPPAAPGGLRAAIQKLIAYLKAKWKS